VELLRTRYKNPKVTGGVYYFSRHKGGQERVRIPAPKPQDVAAILGDLRELIVKGAFVHAPDERDCKFCDYKAACTSDVNLQAKAKLADAKLNAYGRLAAQMAAGIASGVYKVEHIAAVTFTRKAASELRGRFHLALEKRLGEADPE